jgi:hypothetical protein
MTQSLRQYITSSEVLEFTGMDASKLTDDMIIESEKILDNLISSFSRESPFAKAMDETMIIEGAVVGNNSTTLPQIFKSKNYFAYCVMEILSGNDKGKKIPVIASQNGVIEYNTVEDIEAGIFDVRVYQVGKLPMRRDYNGYKFIPQELKEGLAYQVEYLSKITGGGKKTASSASNTNSKKSESIGSNYSYTNEEPTKDTIENRVCPRLRDIVKAQGLDFVTLL